jgi:hypothetical protein
VSDIEVVLVWALSFGPSREGLSFTLVYIEYSHAAGSWYGASRAALTKIGLEALAASFVGGINGVAGCTIGDTIHCEEAGTASEECRR